MNFAFKKNENERLSVWYDEKGMYDGTCGERMKKVTKIWLLVGERIKSEPKKLPREECLEPFQTHNPFLASHSLLSMPFFPIYHEFMIPLLSHFPISPIYPYSTITIAYFIYKLIYIILYNSLFWFIFTKYLLIHNLNLIVFLVLIIHLFSREREGINLGFDSYIKDIFYMPIQLYLLFLTKIQLYLAM